MSHLSHAQAVPASEYFDDAEGWVVESTSYDPPAIPDWEELGYADLGERFSTKDCAIAAIKAWRAR